MIAASEADLVSAFTINDVNEAIGIALAAKDAGMPVVISFTTETDGRLPSGQKLKEAIEETDAATGCAPVYYMINCAHPTHFDGVLGDEPGFSGSAACARTPQRAAMPNSTIRPISMWRSGRLGRQHRELRSRFPQLNILGGCCGTDHRHVEQICFACTQVEQKVA